MVAKSIAMAATQDAPADVQFVTPLSRYTDTLDATDNPTNAHRFRRIANLLEDAGDHLSRAERLFLSEEPTSFHRGRDS